MTAPNDLIFIEKQRAILQQKLVRYLQEWPNLENQPPHTRHKQGVPVTFIKRALEKIQQGTYGVCDECGEGIPRQRLEVVPGAARCVDCQQKIDGLKKGG